MVVQDANASAQSPRAFVTMDAARGIAALCVVAFHYASHLNRPILVPQGAVAVDFFFCLSGFVIAASYADRLDAGLSFRDFLCRRLVRLYPTYLLGTVLGGLAVVLPLAQGAHGPTVGAILKAFSLSLVFLPDLAAFPVDHNGTQVADLIFPLNMVGWSLFFELLVNIVYAASPLARRHASIVAGVALILFVAAVLRYGGPPGWQSDHLLGGFPRATFGFFTGVTIHGLWRNNRLARFRPSPVVACMAVPAMALLPYGIGLFLTLAILAVPLAVAASIVNPRDDRARRLCWTLGEASFPIYMLHFPALQLAQTGTDILCRRAPGTPLGPTGHILVALAVTALSLVVARWFDRPCRARLARWLTGRTGRRPDVGYRPMPIASPTASA